MANFGTNKNSFTNYRYCLHINTLSNWHLFYFLLFKIRFGMILQSSTLSIVNQEHFCYVLLCLSDHLELSQFYNHRLLWIKTSSLLERSKGRVSVKISLLNEFNFVNYFNLMSPQYLRARKHEELLEFNSTSKDYETIKLDPILKYSTLQLDNDHAKTWEIYRKRAASPNTMIRNNIDQRKYFPICLSALTQGFCSEPLSTSGSSIRS